MKIRTRVFGFVAIFLLSSSIVTAQTAPKIEWQHCNGGFWTDGGTLDWENVPKEHMLIRTRDGGYAFLGAAMSNDGDVSGNHGYGRIALVDFWLVKTDVQGNIQWQKCFGGADNESPKCLIQTSDGGYAMCGWTFSHDGDVVDPYTDSILVNMTTGYRWPPTRGWIVKIDSLGIKEWARNLGPVTAFREEYNSVIEVSDGYLIAGDSDGSDEDWHAHSNYIDAYNIIRRPLDALLLKLDRKGQHQWHRMLGGSGDEEATCVLPVPGSGYIFAGTATSQDTDVVTHLPADVRGLHVINQYFKGGPDVWVVRTDANGSILWQKCYGDTASEYATCIIRIPEGYMIAAATTSKHGDVSGNHGDQDAWIFTIDTNGTLLKQKCFGGDSTDIINSIVRLSDGNYAFAGATMSHNGDVSGLHRGALDSTDGWVGEFTPDLNLLWQKCLGGTMSDNFGTVIETADGGLMLNGATISSNGDVIGLHTGKDGGGRPAVTSDIWNVKLQSPNAGVERSLAGAGFSNPYPNPTQDEVYLELFHDTHVRNIEFYDLFGTEVFPAWQIEGTTAVIKSNSLAAGVYLIKVIYENSPMQIRKFVRVL